jgi:hypothetical protein
MLKSEIEGFRFALTHQGLAFDERGLLFDGQHRLWACFLSGIAITVWVFFNEPRINFDVVDTRSKPRTNGQLAVVKGQFSTLSAATAAAAAARFVYAYDLRLNPILPRFSSPFMSREFDAVLAAHPTLPEVVSQFLDRRVARRLRLPSAATIAMFTMFGEADAQKAAIFRHQVLTGENLRRGDPALTLRESAANSLTRSGERAIDIAYRIARAWNHFHAGRQIWNLFGAASPKGQKGRKDGRDGFPEIAGYTRPAARRAP